METLVGEVTQITGQKPVVTRSRRSIANFHLRENQPVGIKVTLRRDRMYEGLREAGYEVRKPEGTFYIFPKTPIPDDLAFVRLLLDEGVLAVPGAGFGRAGMYADQGVNLRAGDLQDMIDQLAKLPLSFQPGTTSVTTSTQNPVSARRRIVSSTVWSCPPSFR